MARVTGNEICSITRNVLMQHKRESEFSNRSRGAEEKVAEEKVAEEKLAGARGSRGRSRGNKCHGITNWSLHFHCRGRTEDTLYIVLFY